MRDPLQYEGRRVLVTGAASGMGAACASILTEFGAEVHALDVRAAGVRGATVHVCDLADPDAIDVTLADIDGRLDALFNCAGLPTTAPGVDVMVVNFLGHRHLTERSIQRMGDGGAIAFVSSVAGMGWTQRLKDLMPLLRTPDLESGRRWCQEHADVVGANGYACSKEAINAYVAWRGAELASRGIRMNSINPGPTDTPMMPSFVESAGAEFFEQLPRPLGRNARPEEQAWALIMLNSPRSSFTTATTLFTDGGFTGGLLTGAVKMPTAVAAG
jgi:NAD(P)-dependent dehydrogenase (short-subunit alcohol dehydrogenase family)